MLRGTYITPFPLGGPDSVAIRTTGAILPYSTDDQATTVYGKIHTNTSTLETNELYLEQKIMQLATHSADKEYTYASRLPKNLVTGH